MDEEHSEEENAAEILSLPQHSYQI